MCTYRKFRELCFFGPPHSIDMGLSPLPPNSVAQLSGCASKFAVFDGHKSRVRKLIFSLFWTPSFDAPVRRHNKSRGNFVLLSVFFRAVLWVIDSVQNRHDNDVVELSMLKPHQNVNEVSSYWIKSELPIHGSIWGSPKPIWAKVPLLWSLYHAQN
jgi:hypothetical protein